MYSIIRSVHKEASPLRYWPSKIDVARVEREGDVMEVGLNLCATVAKVWWTIMF